ncbi:MAG TPA: sulfotransferase [Steroidobacteraceae bacterium]|nr:sulfotransferase [Steroidobacteraceae bacterium]
MQDVKPSRLEMLVRTAVQARQAGDLVRAHAIANRAASEKLEHPLLLRLQAEALAAAGRYAEAGRLLNRALALAPNDAPTITDIGRVLVAENRVEEAITAFEAAVTALPGLVPAWRELGAAREIVGDDAGARAAYERARSLTPGDAAAWAALATIALRRGDLEQARSLAEEAIQRRPDHPGATLVLASTDLERGSAEEALARLEALLARGGLDERHLPVALGRLGDSLDRLGRTQQAFDAYTRMNQETVRANAARFEGAGTPESHLDFVRRLTRWFESEEAAHWREPFAAEGYRSPVRRHVFLLGYPRSGNTLIEHILASLPEVRALEERPTLEDADREFLRDDAALERLAQLDPALAAKQREAYWQRVRAEVPDVEGRVFVDMAPLNGIKLPMISRLFPDAIVVLCRRDPRDVVLSCFRRHFRVNPSTYQMAGLERAAQHYDAVMRLVALHLSVLPLPVHVVEYSALVADFDATTRALVEFVGVPWSAAVRDFSHTAAGSELRTASAPQVRRGLFDGTGQWQRYREPMAPVLPLLEPWVRKFGYPE